MAFGEVGWGADPGRGRHWDGETRPGESTAADGSAWVERGAGDGWTRGLSPWDPAAQASSCLAEHHRASSTAPHPSGKSIFPSNSLGKATSPPRYPHVALTPCFPPSLWDIAAHRGRFVQAKRSLSPSFFFLLFASVWKIIIPQKAIHTTKAQ